MNTAISLNKNFRLRSKKRRDTSLFYLCISPWLVGFLGLTLGPMLYSLYGALSDWDGVQLPKLIGFDNFIQIFTNDDLFVKTTVNTLYYVIASVPTSIILALFLAFILNMGMKGTGIFQAIFYFPSVCAGIAVYLIWVWFFNSELGVINYLLSIFGINGPNWLSDPDWSMPSLVIMNLSFCGSQMLIFLAGLKQIPVQYYEAATIDGANGWKKFFRVTLPMLSPVVLFNTIMGMIGAFQVFGQVLMLTDGGPMQSTYVYGYYIYKTAFYYFKFGYASAISWILFTILMILSAVIMKLSANRVHYDV